MMDSPLLATKISVPPLAHQTLWRARLHDVLERGIPEHKLTLISAPAGYGKTTLLSHWVHSTALHAAWVSLDRADNDFNRFFRYLLGAWTMVHPAIRETPLGLLLSAANPDRDAVLAAFLNAANETPDRVVFVLDDFHAITEPAIHEALTFLLDHLSPMLHLVLAGRSEPPLPLARYRAHHALLELPAEDLQFRVQETAQFLNGPMGLALSESAIATLYDQLEGWVAGLQLVSLAMRRFPGSPDQLVVSGRHRFIADYLSIDVLDRQSEDVRVFLLQTSILDRCCGPLCDAVTLRQDGQEMLELLEREQLFLSPLDERREWFRYHPLFAEFLSAELQRCRGDHLADFHRRAARWYLSHDFPEEAFHHALRGDDRDLVVEILDHYLNIKLFSGELRELQGWIDALPAAWFTASPLLGLSRAGLHLFTGALAECDRCLTWIERQLDASATDDLRWQLARVTSFRCFLSCFRGDLDLAEQYATDALTNLQEDDDIFRADIYGALGDTYRGNGRWAEAMAYYRRAMEYVNVPARHIIAAHTYGALADWELHQGHLHAAASYWETAQAAIQARQSWGRLPLPVIGWVDLRLGELRYEWNDLEAAWTSVERGLERAELGGDIRGQIAGHLLASRITLTMGELDVAEAHLAQARPLAAQAAFPDWSGRFERCQLEVWLARRNLRAARVWADTALPDESSTGQPEREVIRLALVRYLIFTGDPRSRDRALEILTQVLVTAAAEGREGVRIEALALQALAHWQGGDQPSALISLEHALRLAEPEGYIRLFADLGPPMIRLLHEAWSRLAAPGYIATLVAAGEANGGPREGGRYESLEPLSQREQDVLRLLASGLTNREIAETLFISPETVKKHTGHIYDKLDVGNRMEAVARAQGLGLLG